MKPIRILTFALSVFGLVLMSTPIEAQPRGPFPDPERIVAHMQEHLGLSDEQAAEVLAIFEAARGNNACREIEDAELRRDCIREKRAGIEEDLMLVLTPEQFAAWEALREERRARWEARRGDM